MGCAPGANAVIRHGRCAKQSPNDPNGLPVEDDARRPCNQLKLPNENRPASALVPGRKQDRPTLARTVVACKIIPTVAITKVATMMLTTPLPFATARRPRQSLRRVRIQSTAGRCCSKARNTFTNTLSMIDDQDHAHLQRPDMRFASGST